MSKVVLFGCKNTTTVILKKLIEVVKPLCVVTISPELGKKNNVAGYCDLTALCQDLGIPLYSANKYTLKDDQDFEAIKQLNPDIGFVIGWQRLIPARILDSFSVGVFGMHGSADDLPLGRGRSPLNWSLIERRQLFYTNLFKYDPYVDSGEILDTFVFSINNTDTAETCHYKNTLAMARLIEVNYSSLVKGDYTLKKQKQLEPTYYPKRTPTDSQIHWEMDVLEIDAFIRAVAPPFGGAFSYINDQKLIILHAAVFVLDTVNFGFEDKVFGEVVTIFLNGKFLVKCKGGLILVHKYEYNKNLIVGDIFKMCYETIKSFPVNFRGYHDLPLEEDL